ncbi:dicarboxylate/amino acid:cation symporter [Burkholderia cepacia]|uniref:dicarboxylate/amino acid:cation symporter n=1 Tax=Burkholderia cepacia TaxID=292 RepID=UPI0007552648|nr:dicarboxylate/amino acid:cation symporter [Burkholderia cepacia]KUY76934.1 C4-dicarboxylate ABC transporter [Burkholderia cepacia]KUY77529.1 C4-dicarboxylate ABC transporter [Burkholderia cepacia]KVA30913.1 C4-dicarboxylate ABC transporter [Burkholderia cepacia]KVA37154.1 C4-dicarboxylate ABC transporter [Burkholderia cepacia]KVS69399.1 C4-dicarboxylate ABC transporter [Burkholderia cepacia]
MKNRLTLSIAIGMVLGVAAGYACHTSIADPGTLKTVAGYFSIVTDIFLRLIKMIIAPLVFVTLVSGLAGMDSGEDVGRIGLRSVAWFVCASLVSLGLGLVMANALQPGAGLNLTEAAGEANLGLNTAALNARDVITHAFPTSLLDAMARNDILQILVFSVFLGIALSALKHDPRVGIVIRSIDGMVPVMLRLTNYVMRAAPLGVFGAIASSVALRGLDVIYTYGKLIGAFYLGLLVLWTILIGVGYLFLGRRVGALLKAVREPALIAFSTASSEAAYPRLTEQLEKFGVDKKVVGFTLPLGYAFNLDGSMMYQAFAALFIAQAFGVHMPLSQQVFMLLILMLSSKGMASVPRGSVVVVAAVAPMFHLPAAGVAMILAIDQVLDMGRTMTNVIGNSVATAVIAKWEGARAAQPDSAAFDPRELNA